jgi:hypothetical protein
MFIVLLKFSGDRSRAAPLMEGHKAWIKRGFDDGVFLLVGSLQPNQGGGSSRTTRRCRSCKAG